MPRTSSSPDPTKRFEPLARCVAGIAAGREEALRELCVATEDRVHGLALRMLGDPARAEEVTVEVFTRIWRRAAGFDPARGRAHTWIAPLTRSACLDVLRSGVRSVPSMPPEDAEPVCDAPGPGTAVQYQERAARVREALSALPDAQARVLHAAYFQGLTYREVAEALGQPLGTVKTRIRAGLVRLRQALGHGAEEYA